MPTPKFYARWKRPDGSYEIINVFKAIELKREGVIITTPKEVANLYDIENDLKVVPRHGKAVNGVYISQPSFSYYPNEKNIPRKQKDSITYTPELAIFLEVFKDIKKFKISFDNQTIVIYPKKIIPFQRIKINDDVFILQYLVEIDETLPYSEYYRLNGNLALDFYVTSYPSSVKRVRLAQIGLPFFEAKAQLPKNIKIPREFKSQSEILKIAGSVREIYQERNYKLYGHFDKYHLNKLVFLDGNERKYKTLKNYEDQCKELKKQIEQLKTTIEIENEKKKQLTVEIQRSQKNLYDYNIKENYYKEIEKNNLQSKQEIRELLAENKELKDKLDNAQNENANLKKHSFWQRLFNK